MVSELAAAHIVMVSIMMAAAEIQCAAVNHGELNLYFALSLAFLLSIQFPMALCRKTKPETATQVTSPSLTWIQVRY